MTPILSILTPTIPHRIHGGELAALCAEMEKQIGVLPVEHLVFSDNKRRTVGEKRDALLRLARGQYIAFVDDDDWVEPGYVFEILKAAPQAPSVITFLQQCTVNSDVAVVEFKLGNPNEPFVPGTTFRRNAWHVCAWKRTLAVMSHFPSNNYGEDWAFASKLCAISGLTEVHIPRILHHYRHDSTKTHAPPPILNS